VSVRYLLDTNAVSDLVRNPHGQVARRIAELNPIQVCTSIIVAAELRFGAIKRDSRRLITQLETVLSVLDVFALEVPTDRIYGELRTSLERRGAPIGSNDMLIGAHALALGCTLVTANEREFSRIERLLIENWLRPLSH
jgi:tRNA(fMet)-specific endonuclease VapC